MENIINYFSSNIDWCEDNFYHNLYIVEFWNSISSLFITFVGLFGMFIYPKSKILYSSLIPIGITSTYFHGSLSFLGQITDELSILIAIIITFHHINNNILNFCNYTLLSIINFFQICLSIYFPDYNRIILFSYSLVALNIIKKIYNPFNYRLKKPLAFAKIFFYLSVISWCIDYFICVKNVNFHAIWHILIGISAFYIFEYFHLIIHN